MNLFSNIKFLSKLTFNNIKEYKTKRSSVACHSITTDSVHWYGHATTVINLSDTLIVTDPVTSRLLGFFKRVCDIPFDLAKENIHYILLSHGHMDHLSFWSLSKLNKNAVVIVPYGYKRMIKLMGYKKVVVLRNGEVYKDNKIKVTALGANHDGRRFYVGIDKDSNSYLIEKNDKKVFFAGDTAYTEKFKGLKSDVVLMPVGCYKPDRFSYMHCTPTEGYEMFNMMDCDAMVPIHYKTFKISLEDFDETFNTLFDFNDDRIKLIDIGETYRF